MTLLLAFASVAAAAFLYGRHTRRGSRRAGAVAASLLALTWTLLIGKLAVRGVIAGHWPLSNQYEFTLCFVWIVVTLYLGAEYTTGRRNAGAQVCLILLLILGRAIAMPAAAKEIGPLPPVLRSAWLQGHVLTVMVGYGAYGVAAGTALALLRQTRHVCRAGQQSSRPDETASHTEELLLRLLALGFPWLTLGILTGAIWAQRAWGRYWGWDPKETWALIVWLWYLMLFHLNALRRWRGRRLAWLALIGFGLILFTFAGVPALARWLELGTLHGY